MVGIVVLFVLTLASTLALKFVVAPRYGKDVEARFLERSKFIPSQAEALSETSLARWLADPAKSKAISGYVCPVLFPLDIVFLVCLGLFLGLASSALTERLGFLSGVPAWIWWILPACYMAADIAEDTLIAAIFKSFIPFNGQSFRILSILTTIKIASVTAAIGQFAAFGALTALSFFLPMGKST
jgi:hypothetical protein